MYHEISGSPPELLTITSVHAVGKLSIKATGVQLRVQSATNVMEKGTIAVNASQKRLQPQLTQWKLSRIVLS